MAEKLKDKQRKSLIARRIKDVRELKDMSQHELAKALDCTQGLISQYETAISEPPLKVLLDICDAMGCSMDYLLGREVPHDGTSRGVYLKAFDVMSPKQQSKAAMIVTILADTTDRSF